MTSCEVNGNQMRVDDMDGVKSCSDIFFAVVLRGHRLFVYTCYAFSDVLQSLVRSRLMV